MSDLFYIAAILLMFLTLVQLSRSRRHWRDRADEAEFKLNLSRIEITHLREQLEVKNAQS